MNHHFGALGDVWKHLVLAEVLRVNPPRHYWETHAGSASYPLTESVTRGRGALNFVSRAHREPQLEGSAYRALLKSMPGTYPGSALIALLSLGPCARYLLCDTDQTSAESLRRAAGSLDCTVLGRDGLGAIQEALDKRSVVPDQVLVHIDPFDPFETASAAAPSAITLAGALAREGFRVCYWYGYGSKAERGWPRDVIAAAAPQTPLWCGDIMLPSPFVFPEREGAWGCGVLLANPAVDTAVLAALGEALERMSRADVLPGNDPERLTFQQM